MNLITNSECRETANCTRICVISNVTTSPWITSTQMSKLCDYNVNVMNLPLENINEPSTKRLLKSCELVLLWLYGKDIMPAAELDLITSRTSYQEIGQKIVSYCSAQIIQIKKYAKGRIAFLTFDTTPLLQQYVQSQISLWSMSLQFANLELFRLYGASISFLDINTAIKKTGQANCYSLKNSYRWGCPYCPTFFHEVKNLIIKELYTIYRKSPKCIVLDCDNVLWGGVIEEIGIEQIQLSPSGPGKRYYDFQQFLLSLYYRGIILTIASKNNYEDVMKVFKGHDSMLLRPDHIASFVVNWEPKYKSIISIAEMLNINYSDIVFIDDSAFEVEAIRSELPEVKCIQFSRNIYELMSMFNLPTTANQESVELRQSTYKTDRARMNLKASSASYDEYLSALQMHIDIRSALPLEFNRVSELSFRTNRYTNGIRYTYEELYALSSSNDYHLYTVKLKDKFSDLGIIGAIGVYGNTLDLICLSCRALGRRIDERMLQFLKQNYHISNFRFLSTSKNQKLQEQLLSAFHMIS